MHKFSNKLSPSYVVLKLFSRNLFLDVTLDDMTQQVNETAFIFNCASCLIDKKLHSVLVWYNIIG